MVVALFAWWVLLPEEPAEICGIAEPVAYVAVERMLAAAPAEHIARVDVGCPGIGCQGGLRRTLVDTPWSRIRASTCKGEC